MNCSLFIEPEAVKNHRKNCEIRKIFNTVLKINTENSVSKDEKNRDNFKNISGKGMNEFKLTIKNTPFIVSKTAFKNFLSQYELRNSSDKHDLIQFFIYYKKEIKELVNHLLKNLGAIKVQLCIQVSFIRDDNNITMHQIAYFCTSSDFISHISLWSKFLNKKVHELENQIQEFTLNGSDWRLDSILRLDLRVGKYITSYGGCYAIFPSKLKNKKALLNVKSYDKKCLIWCCCAKLFPPKKLWQQSYAKFYKKHYKKFVTKGINFPTSLSQIDKFEKINNHLDFKINIYGYNDIENKSEVFPIRISRSNAKIDVDLLLFEEHYYLIKNFNRLIGSSGRKYHHFCKNCLQVN